MAGGRQVPAYRRADTRQAGAKRRRWPLGAKRHWVAGRRSQDPRCRSWRASTPTNCSSGGTGWPDRHPGRLATGRTGMRRGVNGLALRVQEVLTRDPCGSHVLVFRGERGDLIRILRGDGRGVCLVAKGLERGRGPGGAPRDRGSRFRSRRPAGWGAGSPAPAPTERRGHARPLRRRRRTRAAPGRPPGQHRPAAGRSRPSGTSCGITPL